MIPMTSARPTGTGQRTKSHLQDASTHITSATNHSARSHNQAALSLVARNIKASPGWLWQEKSALQVIRQRYSGERLRAARSIYLALTEVASNQYTPTRAHTSCAYLGGLAGVSEVTARRYLHEFAALGLIDVLPGIHAANTYILLGESAPLDDLAKASMPLADGQGKSSIGAGGGTHRAMRSYRLDPASIPVDQQISSSPPRPTSSRGISSDTPAPIPASRAGKSRPTMSVSDDNPMPSATSVRRGTARSRGRAGDNPQQAVSGSQAQTRGISRDSQIERILDSITKNQQTNRVGGVGISRGATGETAPADHPAPEGERILIASDEQKQAITSLTGIGVRRAVAEKMARHHDPGTIRAWVRYALRASNLKSKAGFVLSRLTAGEAPPDDKAISISAWQQQTTGSPIIIEQQPSWGLREVSSKLEAEITPVAEAALNNELPAPTPDILALWQAALERLRGSVSDSAWGLWLQHVRPVAFTDGSVQLTSPAVGVAETFERRYEADVKGVLGDLLGREVDVEFVRG